MIQKIQTKNHEEWKALRSKYIGGSDAAAVVGMNAYVSPYSLWAEKTGRVPGFEGNLATEVGTYLEEFVAQKFAQETGKKVRRCNMSILNDQYPWAIANIDREIVGEDSGLEIKTTSELNMSKFKNGEYPSNYYCQCMHYLAMTGKKRWYLAVLIGNRDFKIFTIERDEEEIRALMQAEENFWCYVQSNTPPPADGMDATSKTLTALYPDSSEKCIVIVDFDMDLRRRADLRQQISELDAQVADIENRIKAVMGEAGKAESTSYRVTWNSQVRNTFDHKRFASDHPGLDLSKYYKASKSRVFRVSQKG